METGSNGLGAGSDPVADHSGGSNPTIGVLLVNTGTPDAPTPEAVKEFLAEFLADKRVIDYPHWLWMPILHGIILKKRPARSARLYERVWTEQGSPLRLWGQELAAAVQNRLNDENHQVKYLVEAAFRYGNPSLEAAMTRLAQVPVHSLLVVPLFPQSSDTTTGSILDNTQHVAARLGQAPGILQATRENTATTLATLPVSYVEKYFDQPAYTRALAQCVEKHWQPQTEKSHLVISFHGIPARYVKKGDTYPEQCERTAASLASALGLAKHRWTLSYQSKFGPEKWIGPSTVDVLAGLGAKGVPVAVICPGFAVDCLETIDEIGYEAKRVYQAAGGPEFLHIPALNASSNHVELLASVVESQVVTF